MTDVAVVTPTRQSAALKPVAESLLTKREAAAVLAVCPRTVERLIRTGRLPAVKLFSSLRIDPRDLRVLIEGSKTQN